MTFSNTRMASSRGRRESRGIKRESKKKTSREAIVARELAMARSLAGNDPKLRAKVLRQLHKWLRCRSSSSFDFSEYDFLRLWKGLFYCVWMSDKPLVQEELCEDIAKLFECFGDENVSTSVMFYKCFLKTLAKDWFGIDQHRLDKFLMLTRRVTRGVLRCAARQNWSEEVTSLLESTLSGEGGLFSSSAPGEARMALGLQLHIVDFWMEEIAKVSEGKISDEAVCKLAKPFAVYLCHGRESRLTSAIMKNIFTHLIHQTDRGIEYQEKTLAWRNAGYPKGGVDAMVKVEDDMSEEDFEENSDDESDEPIRKTALDPRAGHVDTILPQLPVDGSGIANMLRELVTSPETTSTNRTRMKDIIRNFDTFASGDYPFKLKEVVLPKDAIFKIPKAAKAAIELMKFEESIVNENEEKELRGLSKRQKRRLLTKQRKKHLNFLNDNSAVQGSSPIKKKKDISKPNSLKKITKKRVKCIKDSIPEFTVQDEPPKNNKMISELTKSEKKKKSSLNTPTKKKTLDKVQLNKSDVKEKTPMKVLQVKNNNISVKGETEIIIPAEKKKSKIDKRLNASDSNIIKGKLSKLHSLKHNLSLGKSPLKKVNIALSKNTSHSIIDYVKSVKLSPSIPFDGGKKPVKTSLKPNAMPSPVNPFYKRRLQLDLKSKF